MDKATRLKKIADSFIDTWLIDHPIMVYSLDIELDEYLENVHELKDTNLCNDILREYLRSDKNKEIDNEMSNELLNASEGILSPNDINSNNDPNYINYEILEYLQSSDGGDLVKYHLIQLVTRNSNVRIRTMDGLVEEEQDDPFMPDTWIYHKNWNLKDVLKYIRKENEELMAEDERKEI